MDLFTAATREPATFDHAARALGSAFLDTLRAGVEPARREALDGWLHAQSREDRAIAAWLATEGQAAGWSIFALCREFLDGSGPRFLGYAWRLAALVQVVVRGAARVETPWLWVELFARIGGDRRTLAQDLDRVAALLGDRAWPAIEHAFARWPAFPHRGLLARRLYVGGRVDAALALRWLADPALRSLAADHFRPRVAAHEELLRAELADGSAGTREAIVRLLRVVDARMALDGKSERTDDAELQSRLRATPDDVETSLVWVDLLGVQGDPRGEHIALQHAIASAEPERALELSAAQAAVCGEHRKAIWNRPGGFPFREKYRGRDYVAFHSDWRHKVRGKTANMVDRVQQFANHVTTTCGPVEVVLGRARGPTEHAVAVPPETDLERELVAALGGATVLASPTVRLVQRAQPDEPLADPERLRALCIANPHLTVGYRFYLTWPGTRLRLPHQEAEHYSDNQPLESNLTLEFAEHQLALGLKFPFEDFSAPGFLALHDAICETLGRVMTASRFCKVASSADGKKMIQRLARWSR